MIQINVCDTRWRTAFVAPGFPRLLAYMYTVAIAHAARIHTQESYLSLSSARVYRGREYTCTNVCIGDVAHLPCDMRKLIVCSGIDALENQNPERPPRSISFYPHEWAGRLVPRSRSFISDRRSGTETFGFAITFLLRRTSIFATREAHVSSQRESEILSRYYSLCEATGSLKRGARAVNYFYIISLAIFP